MLKLATSLRKLIAQRDMSVAGISRKSNVPKTNIQGWLDGASPNIVQLAKVAQALNVSIEALAFGDLANNGQFRDVEVHSSLEIPSGTYEVSIRRVLEKGKV